MAGKREEHMKPLISDQAQKEPSITFYAAEYALTPVLGEYHEGLKTVQEAMDIYDKLPEGQKCLKGVGFCLEDGSDYAGRCELMMAGRLQKEFINDIPHYRDSPLVQKAIADMEAILAERERQHKDNLEKETEPPQPAIPHKNEEKSAPIPEADKAGTDKTEVVKTETAVRQSKPAGNDGQADKKAAELEKSSKTPPKTSRDISGGSKKESVLNALRERQAKLKAQEKQEQKVKTRTKGGQEL